MQIGKHLENIESAFGPNRTLTDRLRCCGRSRHCRHSLRSQNQVVGECAQRGTNRTFAYVVNACAAFLCTGGVVFAVLQRISLNQPFIRADEEQAASSLTRR